MARNSHQSAKTQDMKNLVTKRELQKALQRFRKELVHDFKVINEQLVHDFTGAFKDRTELHSDKLENHEERIKTLELRSGLVAV